MRQEGQRSREKKYRREVPRKEYRQWPSKEPFRRDFARNKQKAEEEFTQINRNEVCPFLTRIYFAINNTNLYNKQGDEPKENEIILYLWMNSTLKEITELLRAHIPDIRTKQRFVISRVFQENGKYIKKLMGTVLVHKRGNQEEDKRLDQHNFSIGDFIDVSINYK